MNYRMFLVKTLVAAGGILSRRDEGAVGGAGAYRGGAAGSFLIEATWRSGMAITSTQSPTLIDASTVVPFPSGIKMLVPSADFTTTSSVVSMSTSPRTCCSGVAESSCDSAGIDNSKRPIAASASKKVRPRSNRDFMSDRARSAIGAIGNIVVQ